MNAKQEDKLTMWTATHAVLSKNEDLTKTVKAFYDAFQHFRNIRLELQPDAEIQSSATTGVTIDKAALRDKAVKQAEQMASNIKAYAKKTKNNELKKQFTFSHTSFDRLRDNTFPVIIGNILSKAKKLEGALADYGVTVAKVAKLQETLDSYNGINPAPRLATGDRKQATVNIAAKIKEGEEELEQMDDLIGNFQEENPNFVASYRNARVVISLGHGRKPKDPPPPPEKE